MKNVKMQILDLSALFARFVNISLSDRKKRFTKKTRSDYGNFLIYHPHKIIRFNTFANFYFPFALLSSSLIHCDQNSSID
jgi:hypothetical protein